MKFILAMLFTFGLSTTTWAFDSESVYAGTVESESTQDFLYTHFDWGRGRDGWGYCYEFDRYKNVLNGGYPVAEYKCENVRPSFYDWARNRQGWGDCFRMSYNGLVLSQGRPFPYNNCEVTSRSYYNWARGNNGFIYCYQFARGLVLNNGQPVPEFYCRY